MKTIFEKINDILSEWDPLNVGKDIASDEYRMYVPLIIKETKSKESLIHCLEDILLNKLDISYDKRNQEHVRSLYEVADKILTVNLI